MHLFLEIQHIIVGEHWLHIHAIYSLVYYPDNRQKNILEVFRIFFV